MLGSDGLRAAPGRSLSMDSLLQAINNKVGRFGACFTNQTTASALLQPRLISLEGMCEQNDREEIREREREGERAREGGREGGRERQTERECVK